MADPLISVVMEQLVSIMMQQLTEEINLVRGVRKEVENLCILMKGIQAVLLHAENRRVEERVQVWLEQFQELFYDMDNVFDDWNTAILKKQIRDNDSSMPQSKGKVCFPFSSPLSCFMQLTTYRGIALKIKKLNQRLEFIEKSKKKLDLLPSVSNHESKPFKHHESIELIDKSEIVGRHSDQESLVSNLLLHGISHGKSFDVISIVGAGGLGKTTLAQLAFNDDRVKKNFDHNIWVCISDPFNESQVAKKILESLTGTNVPDSPSLNSLCSQIKEILSSKRILLVLDNVWPHDRDKWARLRLCLQDVAPQSKVLVTTRDKRVAVSMGTNHFQRLDTLSKKECWSLVSKIAFGNKNVDEADKKEFEIVGKKLANKCHGLPLAAKTIGSILIFKNSVAEWKDILVSKLWELENVKVELFPHLFLSYCHLPLGLRHCFKICSIFPKDSKIRAKTLIKIWMSLGYLFSSKNDEDMEGKGYEYVENLVMSSFFQDVERSDVDKKIELFKIHDIVHDFAQYLTEKECIMIESGNSNRSGTWRHLNIIGSLESTSFSCVNGIENIRTLFVEGLNINTAGGFSNFLQHLKYVRCLNLSHCDLEEVPNEVKLLVHLRYLDLGYNFRLAELPQGICDLCNLETLDLTCCLSLTKLPLETGKLISLRHLMLNDTISLGHLPKGILKLTRLRTLNKFIVGRGIKLGDLKYLKHLEGEVSIELYDNEEEDVDVDAIDVFLNKDKITRLSFDYKDDGEGGIDMLTCLEWIPSLITIEQFKFSCRTIDFGPLMSTFRNVKHLNIHSCEVQTLPPLWKLQFLEILQLTGDFHLEYLGVEFLGVEIGSGNNEKSSITAFPKLKALELKSCHRLRKWEDLQERHRNDDSIMPSLVDLKVQHCYNLQDFPHGLLNMLPQLRNVHIERSTELVRLYRKGEWAKHLWTSGVTLHAATEFY